MNLWEPEAGAPREGRKRHEWQRCGGELGLQAAARAKQHHAKLRVLQPALNGHGPSGWCRAEMHMWLGALGARNLNVHPMRAHHQFALFKLLQLISTPLVAGSG